MIDNFTVIVMWMPFTTPNRTLQNDCNPKGDFHQYSVRALSKKNERATCQIVPFDKGSSVVSGEDHGCVKDFLSDCFFSSLHFPLVVLTAVHHRVAQMDTF